MYRMWLLWVINACKWKRIGYHQFFYNYMLNVYLILIAYAKTVSAYGFFLSKNNFLNDELLIFTCFKVVDNSFVE